MGSQARDKISEILSDSEQANKSYNRVANYFGGAPFGTRVLNKSWNHSDSYYRYLSQCNQAFFSIFEEYVEVYKAAERDLEKWEEMKVRRELAKEKELARKKSNK